MSRSDAIVLEVDESSKATFVVTENFSATNLSQQTYNASRYQHDFKNYTSVFEKVLSHGTTIDMSNSTWLGNAYRDVHKKEREAFLGSYGSAMTQQSWDLRGMKGYACDYSHFSWKNNSQYTILDPQQARSHSKMFCNQHVKAHLSNDTSGMLIHPILSSHYNHSKVSYIMATSKLDGTNLTITVAIGADPGGMVYEHKLGTFFNGSTIDDKVQSCEERFSDMVDLVCISEK
jgi:hypothetical protein